MLCQAWKCVFSFFFLFWSKVIKVNTPQQQQMKTIKKIHKFNEITWTEYNKYWNFAPAIFVCEKWSNWKRGIDEIVMITHNDPLWLIFHLFIVILLYYSFGSFFDLNKKALIGEKKNEKNCSTILQKKWWYDGHYITWHRHSKRNVRREKRYMQ